VNGRSRGGGPIALILVGAVAMTPLAVVWLAGALGGLLASGRPLPIGLAELARTLLGLPAHLAHPALAWPADDRARLPGDLALGLLIATCLIVVLVALGAVLLLAARVGDRAARNRAARFASRGELSALRVRRAMPGRVTLGLHRGRMVAAEPRASVLVVGPSQSGKTTGVVVPALLEWSGPVLSTSIKSDVVHDTYAARSARGEVRVFDPAASSELPHAPWSPILAARTWEGARRMAARLLGLDDSAPARSADESFWRPAGARYLAPLLLAAAHGDSTMRDVLAWIATVDEEEPARLLGSCPVVGAAPALDALRSVWEADVRFRSSLLQTVATALDAWQEPALAAATMGDSQITASWLLDGPNTLYLISPAHDQRRLRGLFAALVADVVAGAFERSARSGRPIEPALLLALDEAANIAPLPNLDELASTGPGQGVQLLTVLQNISQAADRWGRDRAETIVANHRARLFCSGIGDGATLEHLRSTLGEEEIARFSRHRQGALQPGSQTLSSDFRSLAPAHRVRQLDADAALLVYGRLAPAWVKLRPWYARPRLRALAAGQAAPRVTPLRLCRPTLPSLTAAIVDGRRAPRPWAAGAKRRRST
jgi:type IV secretion system protein VirD4